MALARGRFGPLLVVVLIAACAGAAVLAAVHLVGRRPRHGVALRDLSATDVLALPARPSSRHSLRLVVLGDSVATGAGCGCRPFGPRLAAQLADRLHRGVVVTTLARDGLATPDLLAQLQQDAATASALSDASVVTVTVGANDFDASLAGSGCAAGPRQAACYDAPLDMLPGRLALALQAVRRHVPTGTQILVTGYWNVFLDGAVGAAEGTSYQRTSAALTQQVNADLKAAAAGAGATYVDLYGAFHERRSSDDTSLLADDGDHPSAAGHRRIAELLASRVTVG